jgi:hypothetical protein
MKNLSRYLLTLSISIISVFLITVSSCLIPHDLIKDNAIKSVEETAKVIRDSRANQKPYRRFEAYGDIRNYAMLFYADNSDPIRSAIEMNYDRGCDDSSICASILSRNDNNRKLVSYNRYWQGQSVVLHFLTIFGSFLSTRAFLTIVFALLLLYTTYKIYKEDKKLALALNIGLMSVNIAFVTRSLEFLPVFFVMLLAVLLVLRSKKNDYKNLDIIFLVMGVLTCYFDFLTCETIVLTIPLIIYLYLEIKSGKKIQIKKVMKLIILWAVGYTGAFAIKWVISYLFMGQTALDSIFGNMTGHSLNGGVLKRIVASFNLPLSNLLPFALLEKYSGITAIACLIVCIVYTIRKNKKYLSLYLVCAIPFIRFLIIGAHSILLSYFTYRAVLCVVVVMALTAIEIVLAIIKKKKKAREN